MTKIKRERVTEKCNGGHIRERREGCREGEDVGGSSGVQIPPPLHSEKAEISGS